ncbi:S-adenosylmethionine-dependent methyltransferase-like protein [Ophiocordyceps sinensis CO18]|uniref:S-adenosylmethionine-dependent methyltransferase-like protein n=1 Tax=Ophiocordyceps sinensis (strain Co18 / CGMCC 3.14243) TaxID=911162 RepID=T4ZWG5_OPHSC|nr:S-adenosylmethionine-dependent methyltransferase-like protein [Ophiocordyceps sinensis CO18]
MVPPGGVPPPNRRLDVEKALRGQAEPAPGPATGYRQGSVSTNPMSPLPPTSGQNLSYRGDRASQYEGSASVDQGRDSPQPSNTDQEASTEVKFKELLIKYKNVKRLYFENKFQITHLTGQVEQLQNAVANQRMSQSRTAWDDNEYSTRFNRLNGAINNLSFNIRKDWRRLPPWLDSYVSVDAVKTGKQEMTAVGRAIVSRWIVEEIFDKCFHPGLDPQLSSQLKQIELSIRGNAYTMHSQEEFDALTTKVVNWRMATLDGLQQRLNSPEMGENLAMLISKATKKMTAYLYQHLNNPPPSGVEGSTSMIAELAVAIATNLPIESRDVAIMYPLPGDAVQTHLMEIEKTGLPTLDSHNKSEIEVVAGEGEGEVEDEADKDMEKGARARGDKTKTGTFASKSYGSVSRVRVTSTDRQNRPGFLKDAGKVRFAGFMALEVRGRQVLMKAPVWTV